MTLFLLMGWAVNAQNMVTVSGTVLDAATGEPVIGASVLVKGTTTGAVADFDGVFSINAPKGAELVVGSIGCR